MRKLLSKKGFTLIELMIVVAIIAILAAVAIPNFLRYQKRSRRAEGELILNGIMKAQKSTKADTNVFYPVGTAPFKATSVKSPMNWFDPDEGYTFIGYVADNYIYCSYGCGTETGATVGAIGTGNTGQRAYCNASCDIDGDELSSQFGVGMADEAGNFTGLTVGTINPAAEGNCIVDTGPVDDIDTNSKLETVVRCTTSDVF